MSFTLRRRLALPFHIASSSRSAISVTARCASSGASSASAIEDDDRRDDDADDPIEYHRRASAPIAKVWLEGEGLRFKETTKGPNWLGGRVPFPMNPSFQPPPPLSNAKRDEIYERYMIDPKKNNVRALSLRYNISLKRVDAILRLKGLEASILKGKQLQTGFQAGMEHLLGIRQRQYEPIPANNILNANAADAQDESDARDRARDRYRRLFWEPVAEGETPMVPRMLVQAKEDARASRAEARAAKSRPELLFGRRKPRKEDQLPAKTTFKPEDDPSRPAVKFVDVGGKFMDVNDRVRRMHEAKRRKEAHMRSRAAS